MVAIKRRQRANAARTNLRRDGQAIGNRALRFVDHHLPVFLIGIELDERVGQRAARDFGDLHDPVMLGKPCVAAGFVKQARADTTERDDLECALAGITHRLGHAEQFIIIGKGAGDMRTGAGEMFKQPRAGKANRACIHGFTHKGRHLRDIICRCRLMVDCTITHNEHPQWGVRNVASDVHRVFASRQPVEIIGEGLPIPVQSFIKDDAGDFLDSFHQLDQRLLMLGQHGGKTNAAIAANRGGHAMREAGVEPVVPQKLAVIMGVDVDKAGGDNRASGVDHFARIARNGADLDDQAVLDRDVRRIASCTRAIDNRAAADNQIKHIRLPLPMWLSRQRHKCASYLHRVHNG